MPLDTNTESRQLPDQTLKMLQRNHLSLEREFSLLITFYVTCSRVSADVFVLLKPTRYFLMLFEKTCDVAGVLNLDCPCLHSCYRL